MDLIQTAAAVMHDHEARLDRCDTIPLKRRPHKPRARPNTVIITRAAEAAYYRRCAVEIQFDVASRLRHRLTELGVEV